MDGVVPLFCVQPWLLRSDFCGFWFVRPLRPSDSSIAGHGGVAGVFNSAAGCWCKQQCFAHAQALGFRFCESNAVLLRPEMLFSGEGDFVGPPSDLDLGAVSMGFGSCYECPGSEVLAVGPTTVLVLGNLVGEEVGVVRGFGLDSSYGMVHFQLG
ncbi:hypothetical protein Acr_15g0003230 [Actinidia rufa]|uniref:Uncharacterized protein n=1 Tax=Actinidia rufa TaxID=165716 RepID=A0A7J0FT20_9ERIC|nr:hypothetical protein Acr_15g0003230 [Actinidia rufa]